jgi:hypothetical protein
LILGGCGDLLLNREMGEESFDFDLAHVLGMTFVVKHDVTINPLDIGLFGTEGIVLESKRVTHLV